MKITHKQLRQIIKEELMREMQRMPIGKGVFGKGPAMAIAQRRMQMRAAAEAQPDPLPPNLRYADNIAVSCGTCVYFCPETQTCMAFNDYKVSAELVCDDHRSE
jgi:Pyruvate/2-oxoacid:ferredoxin oxidoreductase delta subunit